MSMLHAGPEPSADRGLTGPPLHTAPATLAALEKERANPLGSYLRARRERITPEQAGISTTGARRVPGLRREELAMLAGISADYYLRLERGRDRHPSRQVIDALAGALQLDHDQTLHLGALAAESSNVRPPIPAVESIPSSALDLLNALPHPAFIEDRYFNVLAANRAATILNPRLTPGRNQLRDLILDSEERALHPDSEMTASCLIASLRYTMGS